MATFKGEEFKFPDEKSAEPTEALDAGGKVEIEIEDDTPPEDRGRKPMKEKVEDPTDDELSSYDEKVQQRIKKFTRGYHDERRAKEMAERGRQAAEDFAAQVFEENKRLKQQLSSGSKEYIETSKTAAQAELDAAKEKYRKAYEAGDADAVVEAQTLIAKATVKLDKAEALRPIEVPEQDNFRPPQAEPQAPQVSNRTQKWIEKNKAWFGKDDEMTMAAMGLDKKLQREYGADYVGTKEYFKNIDKTMRKRFPEYFGTQSSEEDDTPTKVSVPADEGEPPRRASKPATVVAPATRSTSPNRIRLTASQVALARKLQITPEQYAKQVAKINRGE
jgi:hypothetical protein